MKKYIVLIACLGLAAAASATVFSYDYTVNQTVPDANPTGISDTHTLGGLTGTSSSITDVDVRLNITGGYNGDLFGYLVLQSNDGSTTTAILLNRVGRTGAVDFGSSASGFSNITLTGDTASGYGNIHDATSLSSATKYLADGRANNPAGDFTGSSSTAGLDALNGKNANGTWTLFLADMAGGDQSTLISWGVDISIVPEPVTCALGIFGGVLGALACRRKMAA